MKIPFSTFLLTAMAFSAIAQNQVPVISNLSLQVQQANSKVVITYNLADAENNNSEVTLLLSNDGGQNYTASAGTITGDVGANIQPGNNKQIKWNYDTVSNVYAYSIRLVADDKQLPDIQDIVDAVDSVRLRNDLLNIQGVRHYSANPTHLEEVKDTIESRFTNAGLQTSRHQFTRTGTSYPGENIIGRKPGLGEEEAVFIIDAHFDSVDDAPGADDNGSGVVGFLEALRVLAPYNFNKTIKFIGFDYEESVGVTGGIYGSREYVQTQLSTWETIEGVANFEMIGYYSEQPNSQQIPTGFSTLFPAQHAVVAADSFRGNFITNVGDEESDLFNAAYDSLANIYVPDLKVISLILPINGNIAPDFRRSDHANFWDADVPALMLTDGANFRNVYYHTPADSVGKLNFTFMSNVVKATVATIATLAEIQHSSYVDADVMPSGILQNNANCDIEIFPVSVKNILTIKTGDCFKNNFTLNLINAEGKTIITKEESENKTQLDFSDLPCGIYYLILHNGATRAVKKVIAG
jgi:hypothetical protein